MKNRKGSSIFYQISVLVYVLCGITIIFSMSRAFQGWTYYQYANELNTKKNIAQIYTDALKNFMFERGRMNVVLSAEAPISVSNRSFINERRYSSDQSFQEGLQIINKMYPEEAELLRIDYDKLQSLRDKVDDEAEKPILQRDPSIRKTWYTSCTNYIILVSETLKKINSISEKNSLVIQYEELVLDTLSFRSVVGNEASILTSAVTGRKTLSNEEYATLLMMRGESKQIWADIQKQAEVLEDESIFKAMETVSDEYYSIFRSLQDRVLAQVIDGQVYEESGDELAKSSVKALDSIIILADEALVGIDIEARKILNDAYLNFLIGLIQFMAGVIIIILIHVYLKRNMIKPLDKIICLLEDISNGKINSTIPYLHRKDEVGKLANGLELLQNSIEVEQALQCELQETIRKLEELSTKDPLTGLYNRRYIIDRIDEMEAYYKDNKSKLSIIMCDIDYFKKVNDLYGHDSGDIAITECARIISECCSKQDIVARWGGEEFLLLLPDTNKEEAKDLAEKIRYTVEGQALPLGSEIINITVTLGVSEYTEALGVKGTINTSDQALLKGKNLRRNIVVLL